ncbi:hypothetical protein EA462_16935 [Natrarchaeobius halalkaliphilus]|uniref:Uncharacterized protein n=1 Tax=Natrarchaeobius halalkaliphilus TaxID=1679091 RepID=A0A3N6LX26_9EURY|nr:hypothetical protein EA462_16935 [Natrarchaeobius halalkaliphilus]
MGAKHDITTSRHLSIVAAKPGLRGRSVGFRIEHTAGVGCGITQKHARRNSVFLSYKVTNGIRSPR